MTNRYRIEKILDFLKVPENRLPICLEEFATFLGVARANIALTDMLAKSLNMENTTTIQAYTWIDDGKQNMTITIKDLVK